MKANFNRIAPVYDQLARLVYGDRLTQAKKSFLNKIPRGGNVLLMGGGTGVILNELIEKNGNVKIDFVEPSSAMISIAQKKLKKEFNPRVHFICGDHQSIPADNKYDVVTSFFVMDCFQQRNALEFAKAITQSLKPDGCWLFADFFYTENFFQRLLIWFMYRFFRIASNIPANHLPDYEVLFEELHFRVTEEVIFMNGLIRSRVYKRSRMVS